MKKEKFISIMKAYKGALEKESVLNDAMYNLSASFGGFAYGEINYIVLDLLNELAKDEFHYIEYFIFDLDWGKKWKKGCITEGDGTDIKLKTLDDLYERINNVS